MKLEATHVLLDLDGTISDSSPGIGRSLRHAFSVCGYEPPSDDQVRAAIGPPFEISFPTLGIPIDDIERVVLAYRDRYEDIGLFENAVYPGIADMLDELTAAGHTLSIATAKPEPTARRIIEHFGFADYFEVQAGATVDVGTGRRTKAEVINYALISLRLGPSDLPRVVMVGDRDHDVEGAHLNGIDCVGVTWGFGSVTELETAGAAALADSPGEVAAAVAATYRSLRP
ncbi:MAG TPA: HAD hydrolase-like protein [Ilumatobacteraceae bacterium]|nr:HAD hydrolase-like protein [Ilumatobacteraceae bacterium]